MFAAGTADFDVYFCIVVTTMMWKKVGKVWAMLRKDIREMRTMLGKEVGEMRSVDVRKLNVDVSR